MSSNCPPQLQLSLQPSTTSFKRSFEQFGFDLESPGGATDAGGSGASNGNDRNKRARSASSFSEASDSMDSSHLSTVPSGSSGSSPPRHEADPGVNESTTSPIPVLSATLSTHTALQPPRIPTPDIQDVEMPHYPADGHDSESFSDSLASRVPDPEDRYRLSVNRYNPFDTEMSGLHNPLSNSPLVPRSPTPPPILPPLCISEDQTRLSSSAIPFLQSSPPTTSHPGSLFDNESSSSVRPQSPTTNPTYEEQGQEQHRDSLFQNEFPSIHDPLEFSLPSNRLRSVSNNTSNSHSERRAVPSTRLSLSTSNPAHFRDHLNSALDHLRSPSPLVPGLEDVEQEASLSHSHVNNRISRALPNPPTLPPIITHTDNNNWDQDSRLDIFASQASSGPSRDASSLTSSPTTNFDSRTSASSSGNLDLGDHPLPSPGLHDLHDWMDASSTGWVTSQMRASSDSRQESFNVAGYQATFATSSPGQSRSDHENTSSMPQQLTSQPAGPRSPPLRNRWFPRMSDFESNRRGWPSTFTPTSTSTSAPRSDSDSQLNSNPSPVGLPPLFFNRRILDEAAVRSLDQEFDSELSSARSPPPPPVERSSFLSYVERLRLREGEVATLSHAPNLNTFELLERTTDEADTATSRSTRLATTLARRSRENLSGLLRRTVDALDAGANSPARSPTSQTTSTTRFPDPESQSSTFAESRPGLNNNRDLYPRYRVRAQMTRPGASNSLVNESAAEVRRRADRIEVLERMSEVNREDRGSNDNSPSGAVGDLLDSHLRNIEADLRENGMSSVGWDPVPLNRRSLDDLEAREDSRRLQEWTPSHWNHASWRQPLNVNHRLNYASLPHHNILPLPGLSFNDDIDMMVGEPIGSRSTDFTSGSASSNARNNSILPSSLYDNPGSSRTAGRSSDYFWLNTSHPTPVDQNNIDSGISPELPSSAPEPGTSSSTGGGQRRYLDSSDSSHSDNAYGVRTNQPYLGDPPSLPPPDLGGVFDAERHASSITISDESPETIYVHPPQRSLRDTSEINPSLIDRLPPSIPIQDDANPPAANSLNTRISYADNIRQRRQTLSSELEALVQRQRVSQLEARRISAIAEENRGVFRSNTISNFTSTQAQSNLQRFATRDRSYRDTTIERRHHDHSVTSIASEPPSTRYQGLDPASFTPGPFRNTVQQLFNERRHIQRRPDPSTSAPPTIPPLSFEDNDFSSSPLQRIILNQQRRRSTETTSTNATSTRGAVDDRSRRERERTTAEELRREEQAMARRMSDRLAAARGMNESISNRRRERSDIHRYLTQQARMEASRLEDSEAPVPPSSAHRSGGDIQGLSHAIDALRHDGSSSTRSQQLIERYHSLRRSAGTESESTPITTPVGVPAGPRRPENRQRFLRESIMRREAGRTGDEERFASAVAQRINQEEQWESEDLGALGASNSIRGRRGRIPRAPAEVMYSFGRQVRRVGTFGDYMRDEDFDESYEGLLSLGAALGDAKPKSTPASILSELETAQYKDWATPESDQRCPICLDDYQPTDQVLKLNNCSHWLHKDCLSQWLQGARTCPVCRKSVFPSSQTSSSSRRPHPLRHYHIFGGPNSTWRREPPPPPPPGGGVLDSA